jgi:hypothetical protein
MHFASSDAPLQGIEKGRWADMTHQIVLLERDSLLWMAQISIARQAQLYESRPPHD